MVRPFFFKFSQDLKGLQLRAGMGGAGSHGAVHTDHFKEETSTVRSIKCKPFRGRKVRLTFLRGWCAVARLCGRDDVKGCLAQRKGGSTRHQSRATPLCRVRLSSQPWPAPGRMRKRLRELSRRGRRPRGGAGWGGAREARDRGSGEEAGEGGGGAALARPRFGSRGRRARGCNCQEVGEVALEPRDVRLPLRGHGGAAAAATRDDFGPWPEPKATAAAAAAVPAAGRSSVGLGGGGEAPNPRRGVPLLRGWTSVPGGGVPGFGRRPLPAPQQSQE